MNLLMGLVELKDDLQIEVFEGEAVDLLVSVPNDNSDLGDVDGKVAVYFGEGVLENAVAPLDQPDEVVAGEVE